MSELWVLAAGLLLGLPFGWWIHSVMRAAKKRGRTLLIGLDPVRRDLMLKWVRAGKDGSLAWPRGKEQGEVIVGEGTPWTIDGERRAFLLNRKTLNTYAADEGRLEIAPDDGWTLGLRAVGIHERNVARSTGGTWLEELVKFTPIMVLGLIVIVVAGFAALWSGA